MNKTVFALRIIFFGLGFFFATIGIIFIFLSRGKWIRERNHNLSLHIGVAGWGIILGSLGIITYGVQLLTGFGILVVPVIMFVSSSMFLIIMDDKERKKCIDSNKRNPLKENTMPDK